VQSDLGGRRGFVAEGQIQLDGQAGPPPDDPESEAAGVQIDRGVPGAGGAHAPAAAAPSQALRVDPRLALSGLKKLDRLQDQPTTLLHNLLKQDARHDDVERPPW
jgi:hypothetical protein